MNTYKLTFRVNGSFSVSELGEISADLSGCNALSNTFSIANEMIFQAEDDEMAVAVAGNLFGEGAMQDIVGDGTASWNVEVSRGVLEDEFRQSAVIYTTSGQQ